MLKNNFWLLGIHRNIIAEEKDTDGHYDLVEGISPPGIKTPFHVHNKYAEIEYVLKGELTVR